MSSKINPETLNRLPKDVNYIKTQGLAMGLLYVKIGPERSNIACGDNFFFLLEISGPFHKNS